MLASPKHQDESTIGIHRSSPSWASLPPPFPSHPSRLLQSPDFPLPPLSSLSLCHVSSFVTIACFIVLRSLLFTGWLSYYIFFQYIIFFIIFVCSVSISFIHNVLILFLLLFFLLQIILPFIYYYSYCSLFNSVILRPFICWILVTSASFQT